MRSSRTSSSASSAPSTSIARSVRASTARARVISSAMSTALRCLLWRHLMHRTGRKIEAHAFDLVEVGAGDADEARAIRIIDRVDRAILIDAGVAGGQAISLDLLQLRAFTAIVGAFPFDHVGMAGRLAVDRPGLPMVVRRRLARLVIDVREDLETHLLVLVQHLEAERYVLSDSRLDK